MPGVIFDQGIVPMNNALAAALITHTSAVGLFVNNHTPSLTDTDADYTEATFPGYAQQGIGAIVSYGQAAHVANVVFNATVFTRSGGAGSETVYGYFVIDPVAGVILFAQLFPVPIVISVVGQSVVVIPELTYQDVSV